ncbi:WGR domain-containing protein [Gluconobacter sp. Dm-74]|uniref:WGR domain-containing protein n=1 Tax=unclassified Gluconobacter TaxID=2644261 RepID=UPI001B8C57C9|nr:MULTISPECIES: WGR domain-containing protein [unclassified Gluconobacter]MBS1061348.1 WGR domain-containing protein [Gluconobacter sp. Dm-44]MBS1092558.1 WGR domain-containing protein [Gluconobacter sp. Dm-74]
MPKAPKTAPSRQFSLFPESARLQRIDPATNCWRFYRLTLQDDLFGDPVAAQKEWMLVKQGRGYREDMDG